MTETGFGGGGYQYTLALTPSAPLLEESPSESIWLTLGPDGNPNQTTYAISNETTGEYVAEDGAPSPTKVWQTRSEWGAVDVTGLDPGSMHSFTVTARNQDGVETASGPSTQAAIWGAGSDEIVLSFSVAKATSTVSAPDFMRGLNPGISIAGKNLHELGFVVNSISGLEIPKVVPDEELVPGGHTWHVWDEFFAPKRIVLSGHVHGSTPADLRLRLAYLKSFLSTFEGDPWRSSAPVRLKRNDIPGRHWIVYYERFDQIKPMGRRDTATSATVSLAMKCPMPFAVAGETTRLICAPSAGMFLPIEMGNAPSDAVHVITGPAVDPSFTIGDMVFRCDFADGLAYTDAENAVLTGDFSPAENEAGAYRTTGTGAGLLVEGTDTMSFSCAGNPSDGAWVAVIYPQWQSSEKTGDAVILEHRHDGDNYLRLFWNAASQAWVFRKRADGIDHEISSVAQSFTAGDTLVLGIVYDHTNAGGMKLFIDGIQAGIAIDTAELAGAPDTLTLHTGDGDMQPDAVFDHIAGWSRMLSSDEMLKIASDIQSVKNLNVTVSYTGTLDDGDRLTLDSRLKTAELFDVSAGTRSNALPGITGSIPMLVPGRRRTDSDRTQTVLFAKTDTAAMEIRFNRRYL